MAMRSKILRINLFSGAAQRTSPWRGFAVFVLGVIIGASFTFVVYRPRPGPARPAVIVDPSPTQAARADIVAAEHVAGHLGGHVRLVPRPRPTAAPASSPASSPGPDIAPQGGESASANYTYPPEIVPPAPTSGVDYGQPDAFGPGFSLTVPQEGQIDVSWTDRRTGAPLGSGEYKITGQTRVTIDENWILRLDTTFAGEVTIAINVPDPPTWWVGMAVQGSVANGFQIGGFLDYRKEIWRLGQLTVVAGGSVEVYPGTDLEITARVGVAW